MRDDTARAAPRLFRVLAATCIAVGAVLLGCAALWFSITARTPAAVLPPAEKALEGQRPFRFGVCGDNKGRMVVFEDILARMKDDGVSLVIHTGDIVWRHGPDQFAWALHEINENKPPVPFCAVAGNHDIDEAGRSNDLRYGLYTEAFGPPRYWFSYANALFVAFDTARARCDSTELAWLDSTLTQHRGAYDVCFVFTHYPPRDPRPGGEDGLSKGGEQLVALLRKHRVTALFAGHIHSYLEDNVEGIPVYITGGAGARLEDPGDTYHYLLCTVGPKGSLECRKIDVDERWDFDRLEYQFRLKFPANAAVPLGAGLVVAGIALVVWRRWRARPGPGAEERRISPNDHE